MNDLPGHETEMPARISKQPRRSRGKEKSGFNELKLPGEKAFSHDHSHRISVAFPCNWGFEVPTDHTSTFVISEVM